MVARRGVSSRAELTAASGHALARLQEDWDACRTVYGALKHLEDMVEMTRITLIGPGCRERMTQGLDTILERVQDFTDSAYTTHEHRENILLICDRAKIQLSQLLRVGISMVSSSPRF